MVADSLPAGHQTCNLRTLASEAFRAEATAKLFASPDGQAALEALDESRRLTLAIWHADHVAEIKDAIDRAVDQVGDGMLAQALVAIVCDMDEVELLAGSSHEIHALSKPVRTTIARSHAERLRDVRERLDRLAAMHGDLPTA